MNRLLSVIAAVLAVLLCAVPANATGCRAVVIKKQVVVAQAIVAPVVATYIPVPLYGAAYTPAPQAASDGDLTGAVKGLAEEVRRLTERINAGAGKGGTGPNPGDKPDDPFNPAKPVKADPVLLTFQSKCAACHEATRAKTAGGGFVLLEGTKGRDLTGEDLGKIISAVASGSMPKGGRMTDAERVAFIAALVKK